MKSLALLSVVFLLQKCSAFLYKDKYDMSIAYNVTFVSKCRTEAGRFRVMLGIGLPDCVRECGLRPHCEALSYMRQMQMCNLFTTTNEGNLEDGDCFSISATDIKVEQKPCGNCSKGQVCDRRRKICIYEECLNASINNGVVLGNRNEVGKLIRYKCNHGYRDRNGVQSAVCQDNGEWNVTANCTRVCNYIPTINNGTVTLDKANGNMYMDTATITCDTGYLKSVDTINCTATGDWEHATCDPIDCYVNDTWDYAGFKNITSSGYACERWVDHSDHAWVNVEWIPESTLQEAQNYCRNPRGKKWRLWCFSSNPDKWYEWCDISQCE